VSCHHADARHDKLFYYFYYFSYQIDLIGVANNRQKITYHAKTHRDDRGIRLHFPRKSTFSDRWMREYKANDQTLIFPTVYFRTKLLRVWTEKRSFITQLFIPKRLTIRTAGSCERESPKYDNGLE
jgi:hypothetical protein